MVKHLRLMVLNVEGSGAKVRRAREVEEWVPLSSLPDGVQAGDFVRVTERDGEVTSEIEWLGAAHLC